MASSDKAPKAAVTKRGGSTRLPDGAVRVWSEIGITLPLPGVDFGVFRFGFGHERLARSSSVEEIRNTVRLIDEFNEAELERRVKKHLREFKRINAEVTAESDESAEKSGSKESVRQRAQRQARKGKKKAK